MKRWVETKILAYNHSIFEGKSHFKVSERLEELQKIFTAKEIKENIKLLNHPVNHIRIRVAELIALDPSNISPKLFNMSDRKFIEYKNAIEEK